MHSTAPKKVSTAVMVVTTWSEYGHAHTAAKAAYRVARAGRTMMTSHFRMSYSLFEIFILLLLSVPESGTQKNVDKAYLQFRITQTSEI